MRISDWSSDVCSSDLTPGRAASTRYPADAHHTPRPCPSRHRDARFGARAAAGGTVMSKLKLGPIDDDKPVKLTLELPASVHRDLIAYARVHAAQTRSEENTSELQSLMRTSYAVFCMKKQTTKAP